MEETVWVTRELLFSLSVLPYYRAHSRNTTDIKCCHALFTLDHSDGFTIFITVLSCGFVFLFYPIGNVILLEKQDSTGSAAWTDSWAQVFKYRDWETGVRNRRFCIWRRWSEFVLLILSVLLQQEEGLWEVVGRGRKRATQPDLGPERSERIHFSSFLVSFVGFILGEWVGKRGDSLNE